MSKSGEFLVLDAEPGRFAVYGFLNITLAVWTARVQVDALDRLARASDAYCQQHPEGLSNIHLVQHDIGLPDARTRKHLIEISRRATPHLATVTAVVGGQGFWASRMRSLITGVRMMVPGPFELRLVGSVEEIVEWLPQAHERRTGVSVAPDALRTWISRCDTRALRGSGASGIEALRTRDPATQPIQPSESLLQAASLPPPASAQGG